MGQLWCEWTPTPPADNTTTARQGVQEPRRPTAQITPSSPAPAGSHARLADIKTLRKARVQIHLLTLPFKHFWGLMYLVALPIFFPQFTNTDRKHHRKWSPRSAAIGGAPRHVTTRAAILARESGRFQIKSIDLAFSCRFSKYAEFGFCFFKFRIL